MKVADIDKTAEHQQTEGSRLHDQQMCDSHYFAVMWPSINYIWKILEISEFLSKATSVFHIRLKIKSRDYELPLHKLVTLESQTDKRTFNLCFNIQLKDSFMNRMKQIFLLCIIAYSLVYWSIQFLSVFWVFIMSYIFWCYRSFF